MDFHRTMRDASGAGNWYGVGLAGVHCAISATDSLLVKMAGVRSSSSNHEDAAALLRIHVRDAHTAEQAGRLRRIIGEKNLIEYADKGYGEAEGVELQKQVERYLSWVREIY